MNNSILTPPAEVYEVDIEKFWGTQWRNKHIGIDPTDVCISFKFKYFLKSVLSELPQNARICEIGAGDCQWLLLCKAYRPDCSLHGIDISPTAVELGKKLGIEMIRCDIRSIPVVDDNYDFVFSWGVIEHMLDSDKAFKEQYRISKYACVVDVPFKHSLPSILSRQREINKRQLSEYQAMIEFGRPFTRLNFKQVIESVSSENDSVEYINNYLVFPPFGRISLMLENICPNFLRKRYGHNIGAIVRKHVS